MCEAEEDLGESQIFHREVEKKKSMGLWGEEGRDEDEGKSILKNTGVEPIGLSNGHNPKMKRKRKPR